MSKETIHLRECEVCGTKFQPKRSDQRYCSKACRQKNYVQNRALKKALEKKAERETQEELILTTTTQELLHEDLQAGLTYVKTERQKLESLREELRNWDSSLVEDREMHLRLEDKIEYMEVLFKNKQQEVLEGKKREAKLESRIEALENQLDKMASKMAKQGQDTEPDQMTDWLKALAPALPTLLLYLKDQKQDGQLAKLLQNLGQTSSTKQTPPHGPQNQ